MTDCAQCGRPVDGMWCPHGTGGRRKRNPPPMGWEALKAMARPKPPKTVAELEAEAERAAIQGEAALEADA